MIIFALNFYSFILEFYENCGKVQCWKNEECCKMKCDENGLMIPDSQCLPTNPESSGCPLFICESPQTTNKSIINYAEIEFSAELLQCGNGIEYIDNNSQL